MTVRHWSTPGTAAVAGRAVAKPETVQNYFASNFRSSLLPLSEEASRRTSTSCYFTPWSAYVVC
jgi:hypothetical protein